MSWFGSSKPTVKESQRDNRRALNRITRDVNKEKRDLEIEEKKLELEIKKCAQAGNKEGCTVLAKQLVNLRKQKTRLTQMNSKVRDVSSQNTMMGANVKLVEAMSATTKTMSNMNKVVKPEAVAADMRAFQIASAKANMTDEFINSTLDDILTESGDEEEGENYIQQVLSEIGIEVSEQLARAKPVSDHIPSSSRTAASDKELEDLLEKIRTS